MINTKKWFGIISLIIALSFLSSCQKKPQNVSQVGKKIEAQPLPGAVPAPQIDQEAQSFFEADASKDLVKDAYKGHLEEKNHKRASKSPKKNSQIKAEGPTYDIPIVINEQVEKWLAYFQNRGRKSYAAWLARSGKYIPMMKKILTENGLPLDLVYLSMIESGYKPRAYSHASASGLWQFIRGTGKRYGLKSNWWIDERRDAEKSTLAAAQYLSDLYEMFDHWYLAAAGYNAGENKILRAIKRYDTNDFWEMSQSRFRYLKPETKNYVPKIIAASIIAKEPERYGFTNITYDEPLKYSKVLVQKPTELAIVAKYLKISHRSLKDLNPELLRGVTPPKSPNYELKIPYGMQQAFEDAYPKIKKHEVSLITKHRVRKGDVLSKIAKKYNVPYRSIMSINNMSSTRIKPGQMLVIPQKKGSPYYSKANTKKSKRKSKKTQSSSGYHKVKRGDSLWSISRKYDVSVSQLRQWNTLKNKSRVNIGQKIYIQSPSVVGDSYKKMARTEDGKWIYYKVKDGDSIWSISKKYGANMNDVIKWNDLNDNNITLYPGNTIKIKAIKS